LIAMIVLHDAWFYWTHRLIHDPRLFRRIHRTHHRSNYPTPFTAYSFDLGEAAINAAFVPLFALLIPVSFLAIGVFATHMILRNVVGHSGYELFPARRSGRPLFDFLTSVTHHDLHHAQAGWNYGLYFTFWDRLMGTEHPLYHEKFAEAVRKPLDGSAVMALGLAKPRTSFVSMVGDPLIQDSARRCVRH
ncbi:MAG: sterol desaturase family protein, partial [Parvularculaceae bacterium]